MNIVGKHRIKFKAKTTKDGMLFHIESEELEKYFMSLSTKDNKVRKNYHKYQGLISYSPHSKPYHGSSGSPYYGRVPLVLEPWGNFSFDNPGNYSFIKSVGIGSGISFITTEFVPKIKLDFELSNLKEMLEIFRKSYINPPTKTENPIVSTPADQASWIADDVAVQAGTYSATTNILHGGYPEEDRVED